MVWLSQKGCSSFSSFAAFFLWYLVQPTQKKTFITSAEAAVWFPANLTNVNWCFFRLEGVPVTSSNHQFLPGVWSLSYHHIIHSVDFLSSKAHHFWYPSQHITPEIHTYDFCFHVVLKSCPTFSARSMVELSFGRKHRRGRSMYPFRRKTFRNLSVCGNNESSNNNKSEALVFMQCLAPSSILELLNFCD